eukprot:3746443-Prymnesium_polylepis.1
MEVTRTSAGLTPKMTVLRRRAAASTDTSETNDDQKHGFDHGGEYCSGSQSSLRRASKSSESTEDATRSDVGGSDRGAALTTAGSSAVRSARGGARPMASRAAPISISVCWVIA